VTGVQQKVTSPSRCRLAAYARLDALTCELKAASICVRMQRVYLRLPLSAGQRAGGPSRRDQSKERGKLTASRLTSTPSRFS